jgi:hypothetical protein
MDLKKLLEPIPYKYRLQSAKNGRATIVSYIDSRQVQDRLDEVVGAANWQDDYKIIDGNLFCGIAINVGAENGRDLWVTKTDVGTESNVDKEKGEVSDAFKRAAVKWGIGRFLYSLGIITLKTKVHTNGKEYPCKDDGVTILWSVDELTEYCKLVVASGELDRTKKSINPIGTQPTPKPVAKEVKEPSKKEEPTPVVKDEAKEKARELFSKLDTATVLKSLIVEHKMKYTNIGDFLEKEPIEKIREVYSKLTAK